MEEAARYGHDAVVRWLIHHGADVNAPSSYEDQGPLWYATLWGHDATVRLLLDSGAIIRNTSAFEVAVRNGSTEVLKTLLLYSGKVNRDKVRALAEDALRQLQNDKTEEDAVDCLKSVLEANP
jgi:ankyrin repeat protein